MRIAFVSDAIWPYNKGGKEKRMHDISIRLAQKGHDVHIFTMKWWQGDATKVENGVTLHAISPLYPLYAGPRRSIKQGILFGLMCFKLIKETWDVIDVDHMPFFPLFSVKLVCLLKGKKMTATWNEVWGRDYWVKYMGLLGNISYIIERLSVLLPDKIISISELTTNKLKTELKSAKQIVTIPIGVDIEHIQKIKPSKQKSDVIYVGRLLSHKNVDVLIKAVALLAKQNKSISCLIIGTGPELSNLQKLTRELKLEKNVAFLTNIKESDEVYALMKSSKVFVLPSTREGFGIVVLEANACGIPVITVDHEDNAAKDFFSEGMVNELTKIDSKSLSSKLNQFLAYKQTVSTMDVSYTWDFIIAKYIGAVSNAQEAR